MHLEKERIYILDGATGTELYRRGFHTELPLWSAKALFDDPELVKKVHVDYIRAGADIITTNTFRTQEWTFAKVGLADETERINKLAVEAAIEAREEANAQRPIYIAGCITTLEDCYRPDLSPSDEILKTEHGKQAKLLAKNPIDFFMLETFNNVREAYLAADAVWQTGKNFAISFVLNADSNLLSGESLQEVIEKIEPLEPIAFLVNCIQPALATRALKKMKTLTQLPLGAYANGDGDPDGEFGWQFTGSHKIRDYADHCVEWKNLGATIIGGCCGTTPEYTEAYSRLRNS